MHVEGRTVLWITTIEPSARVDERTVGAAQDLVDAGVVDDADAQHVGRRADVGG